MSSRKFKTPIIFSGKTDSSAQEQKDKRKNCCLTICCLPCIWGKIAGKTNFGSCSHLCVGAFWCLVITYLFTILIICEFLHDYYVVKKALLEKETRILDFDMEEYDELDLGKIQKTETSGWYVAIISIISIIYFVLSCLLREHVRLRYNLKGNLCFDFCAVITCHFCSIRQMGVESGVFETNICNFPNGDEEDIDPPVQIVIV